MPQGGTNLIGGPITLIPSEEEEEELIGGEITLIPTLFLLISLFFLLLYL